MFHEVTGVVRVEWQNESDYHRHQSISSSRLRDFVEHGPTYYAALHIEHSITVEPTDRMQLGSMLHEVVLAPEWQKPVVVIPPEVLAKNGARSTNAYRDFEAENQGKWLLKREENDHLAGMVHALRSHGLANELLFPGKGVETEVPLMTQGDSFPLRCRVDALSEFGIADLKLHDDLNPARLAQHITKMRYDQQLAFYAAMVGGMGPGCVDCYLVFCRSEPPFQVRVVRLQPAWIDSAQREYMPVLEELSRRHAMNAWFEPDDNTCIELERPAWASQRDAYLLYSEADE